MHLCTHIDSNLLDPPLLPTIQRKGNLVARKLRNRQTTFGDTQGRHEMAVGTLARAERASWTGAGGSVCQTRLPCALNTVFIAAGLLVCLVGD